MFYYLFTGPSGRAVAWIRRVRTSVPPAVPVRIYAIILLILALPRPRAMSSSYSPARWFFPSLSHSLSLSIPRNLSLVLLPTTAQRIYIYIYLLCRRHRPPSEGYIARWQRTLPFRILLYFYVTIVYNIVVYTMLLLCQVVPSLRNRQ